MQITITGWLHTANSYTCELINNSQTADFELQPTNDQLTDFELQFTSSGKQSL